MNKQKIKELYTWTFSPIAVYLAICGIGNFINMSGRTDWFRPVWFFLIIGGAFMAYLYQDELK